MRSSKNPTSGFNPDFLDRPPTGTGAARRSPNPGTPRPWTVRQWRDSSAVLREAESGDGTPDPCSPSARRRCSSRQSIPRWAPSSGFRSRPPRMPPAPTSTPSSAASSEGRLAPAHAPELVEALNVVEWLLRSQASLALGLRGCQLRGARPCRRDPRATPERRRRRGRGGVHDADPGQRPRPSERGRTRYKSRRGRRLDLRGRSDPRASPVKTARSSSRANQGFRL